jgi:hypothetical protein
MLPILVCYLKPHIFEEPQILESFQTAVNKYLESKGSESMVFFIPTDKDERIECINPVYVEDAHKAEYDKMIGLLGDLEKRLDMKPKSFEED